MFALGKQLIEKYPKMRPFNPVQHGLRESFKLTDFAKMKG
jgi:hypothetical protein